MIEIGMDENIFLDTIGENDYIFVLYDNDLFVNMECIVSDLIRDSGAKPFVLVSENKKISLRDFNLSRTSIYPLYICIKHPAIKIKSTPRNS